MELYSTKNKSVKVSFKEAVLKGISDDGGLFMPYRIPALSEKYFKIIRFKTLKEIAFDVSTTLLENEIPDSELKSIIDNSITFDAPLTGLDESTYVLELFHGPTLAFKDFGARFMANVLSYFNKKNDVTILVATSGDTGSAVANGFYNVEGIKVVLLYPSGKVSKIQEQQLTTLGGNITALEVEGTFDDCQRLVKQAFADVNLKENITLSSANSINIARLIPQSFYYFYAYSRLPQEENNIVFSVPSGNFGNLTGGLIANKMGLPVRHFIASVNANDVFPNYLIEGKFEPKSSVKTISNAMDVGNPSNFSRVENLFCHEHSEIKNKIESFSFSDEETKKAMKEVYKNYNYIIDPHGAVGYLGMKSYRKKFDEKVIGIILETAHPAKFKDVVDDVLNIRIVLPAELDACINKKKKSIKISNGFNELKDFLMK